jgi:hypothetical protein
LRIVSQQEGSCRQTSGEAKPARAATQLLMLCNLERSQTLVREAGQGCVIIAHTDRHMWLSVPAVPAAHSPVHQRGQTLLRIIVCEFMFMRCTALLPHV